MDCNVSQAASSRWGEVAGLRLRAKGVQIECEIRIVLVPTHSLPLPPHGPKVTKRSSERT